MGTPVRFKLFPWEALTWFLALVALALIPPGAESHFTICPLALADIGWCPGCGLGRSVSLLLHGELRQSWAVHPLAIFAVIVLSFRILSLTKNYIQPYGKNH